MSNASSDCGIPARDVDLTERKKCAERKRPERHSRIGSNVRPVVFRVNLSSRLINERDRCRNIARTRKPRSQVQLIGLDYTRTFVARFVPQIFCAQFAARKVVRVCMRASHDTRAAGVFAISTRNIIKLTPRISVNGRLIAARKIFAAAFRIYTQHTCAPVEKVRRGRTGGQFLVKPDFSLCSAREF